MSVMTTSDSNYPVLILIHGATLNGRMWDPVRRFLDPRYRVLTPDLPGHGSRRAEKYTLQGAVDTVVAAARSVAPAKVAVCGDSLGGYTTLASASALPQDQLIGLIPSGSSFNFVGRDVWPYLIKGAVFSAIAAIYGEQRFVEKVMPKTLTKKIGLSEEDARAMIDAGMSIRVFPQAVRALRNVDFRAKLAAITQPVLIVNGSKDKVNVREEASFMAVAQNASSYRFEDCEHGVTLWRYREFALLVNEFVAKLAR